MRVLYPVALLIGVLAISACGGGGGGTGGSPSQTPQVAPPSALSYPSPQDYVVGEPIAPISPLVTGTVATFTVSPALPAGLQLNPNSGQISGTPAQQAQGTFTVTASNASGSTTFALTIRVTNPPVPATAPAPSLVVSLKRLRFAWNDVPGATFYRLERSDDGASFVMVGADIARGLQAATVDLAVHAFDWSAASFRLSACNVSGCVSSQPMAVAGRSRDAIGYLKASNTEADDQFGSSVAISADGRTAVVGAPSEDSSATTINGDETNNDSAVWGSSAGYGAAYVLVRSNTEPGWVQQAYIKASSTESLLAFGSAVTLSGDGNTLAVALGSNGDVHVFQRAGQQWSEQARIANHGSLFGFGLALSADGATLAIGSSVNPAGAVYVYTREANQWVERQTLSAPHTFPITFGFAVDVSDDGSTIAVGAWHEGSLSTGIDGDETQVTSDAGAAYVFVRSSAATWVRQAYVKASNTDLSDWFGYSVALSGDGNTLAVGAFGEDSPSTGVNADQGNGNFTTFTAGAVYVYARAAGTWRQQAYVKASNTRADDWFGRAVSLSADGNTLAVGAPLQNGGGHSIDSDLLDFSKVDPGAVYVYKRNGEDWRYLSYVKAPTSSNLDQFGTCIALDGSGETLIVGAPPEASNARGVNGNQADASARQSGAAYLY